MLIDVHGHIWAEKPEESRDDVLRTCERYGVRMVFISTLFGVDMPTSEEIRTANGLTWAFMRLRPELVKGMAYINPTLPDFEAELRECLGARGMSGVKLWLSTYCDDPAVDAVAAIAMAYDVPVLIHAFYKANGQRKTESRGSNVQKLAERHPNLRIIMAHLGANVYDAIKCIKGCPNVMVDFSGSIYRRDDLDYTIRHIGVERVLFGSDMPSGFVNCLGQVAGAALTEEERNAIMFENAKRLFKL
ncbi:MAG: amidohydrolase [Clostridiales bacterium]|jgi:predicted TIM-barrel fold metal-dependent hydrolase|nr:amidohydrolase [Clostridiales bacterium]